MSEKKNRIEKLALEFFDEEDSGEYKSFVEKFKPKRTTDDCFTPEEVYEAVKAWVLEEVPAVLDLRIVRPFYPGGDYQAEDYTGAVVIDNPPFSILSEIKSFYLEREIPFFLFAPSLTLLTSPSDRLTSIVSDANITYTNGAVVSTGFVSNLFGDLALILAPELKQSIEQTQAKAHSSKGQARYVYPYHVVSGALLSKYVARGLSIRVRQDEVHFVRALDHQRRLRKAIYGSGMLVSDRVAEALRNTPPPENHVWKLSPRELDIIKKLSE